MAHKSTLTRINRKDLEILKELHLKDSTAPDLVSMLSKIISEYKTRPKSIKTVGGLVTFND